MKGEVLEQGRYRILEEVGEGQFGRVYKALDTKQENKVVAIKKLKMIRDRSSLQIMKELAITRDLDHPNVMRSIDFFMDHKLNTPVLVMEFYELTLSKYLEDRYGAQLTFSAKELVNLLLQVFTGLAYLDSCNIAHRDVKADNVLVKVELDEVRLILSDFGTATQYTDTTYLVRTIAGTLIYMAPEIGYHDGEDGEIQINRYDPHLADVYSAGRMIVVLVTGSEKALFKMGRVNGTLIANFPNHAIQDGGLMKTLCEWCTATLPENRPIADDVVQCLRLYLEDRPWSHLIEHARSPIRIVQQEDDQPNFSLDQDIPPPLYVKKGASFRLFRGSPPPSDNRVEKGEIPPINILQTVEALYNFILGGFDEIAENLRNLVYAVHEMNSVLENHADSPLQGNFKETQEGTLKLVDNTKTWIHDKDAPSKNKLEISSSHVVLAILKMTDAWEELKTIEDHEIIVKATQQAANVTVQLLRTLYMGAYQDLDSIIAEFSQKCDLLTELVNEKLLFLAAGNRKLAKDSIDKFYRINKQVESHVTHIKMGDEKIDDRKVQIGVLTKELVASLRDITSIFEYDSPATRRNLDENSLIAEVSKKFQDETVKLKKQTVGHHEIISKMSALSLQLVQLTRETNKDERISCLTRIIIIIAEVDHLIQVDVVSSLSVISPYIPVVQKFASHLMLSTTLLSSDVEIRPKFRGKFLLGESLSEVMTIFTMLLHMYFLVGIK